MISGLGSSVTTSLNSVAKAQRSMDRVAEQMASGKRVASVRDDGAAWLRANSLKGTADTSRTAVDWIGRSNAMNELAQVGQSDIVEQLTRMKELVLAAQGSFSSVESRTAYDREYQGIIASLNATQSTSYFYDITRARIRFTPTSIFGEYVMIEHLEPTSASVPAADTGFGTASAPGLQAQNLATATQAQLANTLTQLEEWLGNTRTFTTDIAAMIGNNTWIQRRAEDRADRTEAAAAALTEADLGRLSTERGAAQARSQLAVSTIRAALDQYSAYATGLLGGVQRTQRSVMA